MLAVESQDRQATETGVIDLATVTVDETETVMEDETAVIVDLGIATDGAREGPVHLAGIVTDDRTSFLYYLFIPWRNTEESRLIDEDFSLIIYKANCKL